MAITLNIRATFSIPTKKLAITDLFDYVTELGVTGNQLVSVNYRCISPLGVVFYNNTSLLIPDIDPDNTSIGTTKSNISLPTDISGNVLQGTYTIYATAVNSPLDTTRAITGSTPATKTIVINGNFAAEILVGAIFRVSNWNGTGLNRGVSVASATNVGGTTEIVINETFTSVAGNFVYCRFGTYVSTLNTTTFYYCDETPDGDLDVSHDCRYSQMQVVDNTDYDIIVSGTPVAAYSTSEQITINYPTYTGLSPVVTTESTYILGPNIWTSEEDDDYEIDLETDVVWLYPSTSPNTMYVEDTVTDTVVHEVYCNTCECDIFQCVDNLWDRYYEYKGTNAREAERLQKILIEVMMAYQMYQYALSCGEDYSTFCEKIATLAASEDCQCSSTDPQTGEIIPVLYAIGTGTTTGTEVLFGVGTPAPGLGRDKDVYCETVNSYVYKKISGSWVYQGSAKGVAGATGAAGADGASILYEEFTAIAHGGTGIETLKSYTVNCDTRFNTNGDTIEITAQYTVATNVGATAYITFDGNTICGAVNTFAINPTDILIKITMTRKDANTLICTGVVYVRDTTVAGFVNANTYVNNFYTQVIALAGNKVLAVVANANKVGITSNIILVKHFNKA